MRHAMPGVLQHTEVVDKPGCARAVLVAPPRSAGQLARQAASRSVRAGMA
jgi:hypothetical protein